MPIMSLNLSGMADSQGIPAVVVLGGSGFIGARLTALLIEQNVPVRIGDLRPSETFPNLWVQCDLRRKQSLADAVQNANAIINLAAEHRDDVHPLSRYQETNVEGASQVCHVARNLNVRKIIFTSSAAVYGFHTYPVDESGPFAPFNAYGKTKLEAEGIYRAWADENPSRTLVIVRPTVVFGEGNRGNVYNLLQQIASDRFLMVGPGQNAKSMAYVGNVAAFLIHALSMGPGIHTFNYVDGPDMNMRDLIEHIRRCLGMTGRVTRVPKSVALAGGHILDLFARLSGRSFPVSAIRIRKFCESTQFRADRATQSGFTPPYSLQEGLARTIEAEFKR